MNPDAPVQESEAVLRRLVEPVTVAGRDDQRTSITGVQAGARVVVQGAGFLNEGDRVTVVTAQTAAAAAAPAGAASAGK